MTLPETLHIPAFQSFTLAILLFFAGQKIAAHWGVVRRYSVPEPVVGGFCVPALWAWRMRCWARASSST